MNGIRDTKSYGLPSTRPEMSTTGENFCLALVILIALLTAYGLTTNPPARQVVDVRVTMTSSEYAQALDRARRQGEADMLKRMRACTWQDTFRADPPLKREAM